MIRAFLFLQHDPNSGILFFRLRVPPHLSIVHVEVRLGNEVIKEADVTLETGTEKYFKVSFGLDSLFYHWKF